MLFSLPAFSQQREPVSNDCCLFLGQIGDLEQIDWRIGTDKKDAQAVSMDEFKCRELSSKFCPELPYTKIVVALVRVVKQDDRSIA
ncbi:hypothetical protein WT57_29555 [Burkholderia pseudomultivorans]|uniref:Uncharacterized protein n=1 Tax=Burkholderia pseudomultivorans TaxID=1207504 RepID=A0A132ETW2_9BURK|nr:hypothetical protein WT57_29555 [Burkholderia pseudomultivorans]